MATATKAKAKAKKQPLKAADSERDVFTTGQVAKLCRVAPRTVSKWCDVGALECYRIPLSQDRRIPRDALVAFLQARGLPLRELAPDAGPVAVGLPAGWVPGVPALDPYTLARRVADGVVTAVVFGAGHGLDAAAAVAVQVLADAPQTPLAVVAGDDRDPGSVPGPWDKVFSEGEGPAAVLAWLESVTRKGVR